ncbi:MAG: hypothetical protein UR17_C0001G0502 [Candidatus Woesebacteria bacterium GW2011_GWF1_31_35]|uniref:Uncharacterized protein n=1 Tax=Candidatus Woesebacteria bacterium GW2011_GWC2_31_9 TaxID=1618586 RepID=A0A0F9YIS5_9BACT|nr:MAG: hypothetical protein UR17_C0001G0502 [Candidatus Woesebacteria bacterium GW2011_GWF1_31_35]KKP23030.1 MAG: hypothetical protein UR11_C0001G0004 [Candidatus Woesebacteria bacterium GW2011_GWC1_30_29]KKP25320.1 MAG: hypothetical protein UR13_C0009G0004 [Candidatus Woesebacteria bacterium GW2011_GWD1_31_12]KKP27272.1 MAG: hypothetical protein UR16_C0004G0004 [Candidatus Woesebacteria bacterium GW2011_GWB1_31_29]KKP31243.1 MAG: hypothetical protein UR21_C0013G0037 [Candidatus Woesebacteria 
MIYFALLTLGYFLGVFTAMVIFPPKTNELREQEKDALTPILNLEEEEKVASGLVGSF